MTSHEQEGKDAAEDGQEPFAHRTRKAVLRLTAQRQQQPSRGRPDRRARWQQRSGEHRRGHQCDGDEQHVTPPAPVADMAEENRPKGSHQIGDGKATERDQERTAAAAEKYP